MAANYNNSAWFYDALSRVIYGKTLIRSQVYLLMFVPPRSVVLIVGGGTGLILEELAKIHPSGLKITYVEIAPKMIALSRKRAVGGNEVIFINKAIEDVSHIKEFDVVITPFLFDNFTEDNLQKIFAHIHTSLKAGGHWLNTDFHLSGKWWQKVLLKAMLLFFRMICDIEAKKLPDYEKSFEENNYKIVEQKSFFGDFILSTGYKKL